MAFENGLNMSETARQLHLHRNTLVYRLEKLQKATGLDIRVFEDAMTFQIALSPDFNIAPVYKQKHHNNQKTYGNVRIAMSQSLPARRFTGRSENPLHQWAVCPGGAGRGDGGASG
mgnify:CR=1 FL=1